MLSIDRQTKIIQLLKQNNSVRVSELKALFNVSEMTIRRDLEKLEQHGVIIRSHGGAALNPLNNVDVAFQNRTQRHVEEKEAIAREAAALVQDGDSIVLDAGTTTTPMVKYLRNKKDLVVLTNSLTVANEMAQIPGVTLVLTGGNLREITLSLVGTLAEENLRRFYVDKAFIGTSGLCLVQGLTNQNMYESEVKRAMISIARETIVLADHSKFHRVSFSSFSPLQAVHKIITDTGAPMDTVKQIRELGIEVLLAKPGP
ncbi:DeoR/GlpR family DNA-binding transcription regulator [Desulforamulus ruminis]|uniref:Regulatory protein DeoR n=1 Tax=Desulforamulus ruminis (strain ATCC 23193 / DSM 2154 / NCIMB 8452 / DL) TaxID=696281 RepID=F6DUV5_DESRL|nr:DeoR/GlpR family DNA-binding transcription regulator [Desulforamulus ruminis]AEG61352.1 regulatory protein DeoR [Desulforamulus ruminis DSM 2154]